MDFQTETRGFFHKCIYLQHPKKSTLKLAIIYSIDLFNDSKIPHVTTHDQIHIFLKSCKYVTIKVTPFF